MKTLYKIKVIGRVHPLAGGHPLLISVGDFYAVAEKDVDALKKVVDFIDERHDPTMEFNMNDFKVTKLVTADNSHKIEPRLLL